MSRPVRLLGHRGASAKAAENTVPALQLALEEGADGFEVDVRHLADGTPVLMHDAELDRMTNGAGPLAACSVEQLAELRVSGHPVPTLAGVLDGFFARSVVALEFKEPLTPLSHQLLSAVPLDRTEGFLILASFQESILEQARDLLPAIPRALVLKRAQEPPTMEATAALGISTLFVRHEDVDPRFIVECRRRGLAAWAYTVNDRQTAASLVVAGIEGILSDDPGSLRSVVPG